MATVCLLLALVGGVVVGDLLVENPGAGDVSLLETFKGVVPFLIAEFLRVSLIIAFPAITLVLIR